ncbi:MAG: ATP-binding protein [Odoribacter sp.]|nr:ATP-binding protein [Odoribacter sp.]
MNKLQISIPSDINNIMYVENFVDDLMGSFELPKNFFGRITLSVVEAVNNAILFGNNRQLEKKVAIIAEMKDKQLFVSVRDEGKGFDYSVIPDPTLPVNIDKEKGRGLYLMKSLSDNLEFSKDGSEVTLIFDLV